MNYLQVFQNNVHLLLNRINYQCILLNTIGSFDICTQYFQHFPTWVFKYYGLITFCITCYSHWKSILKLNWKFYDHFTPFFQKLAEQSADSRHCMPGLNFEHNSHLGCGEVLHETSYTTYRYYRLQSTSLWYTPVYYLNTRYFDQPGQYVNGHDCTLHASITSGPTTDSISIRHYCHFVNM